MKEETLDGDEQPVSIATCTVVIYACRPPKIGSDQIYMKNQAFRNTQSR